ncbi:T-cell surface glycoprotein CD3 zeta chain [Takifugu rubripes]|uniref:T-cell surface glycoprotein CD3 zeta chain n=1 Tax=Takifugu rubripes TaxID=31033 RepID=A0A3B5KEI8_TAKRU|nr:T-cell surface glycoprotein CD3 zeta chain [Takifugu rubripes]|eukprot:XP_011604612.1 PREDICTED: T-cell surface glycoprotein CD3 zeta chain [Takifugu rubripes]
MELSARIPGVLVLASVCRPAEAMMLNDPRLCYILDVFLGVYGLVITGMLIREKFFRSQKTKDENLYSDLQAQNSGGYAPVMRGDPERGNNRRAMDDDTYTDLNKRTEGEYKELPVKRERQRKNEQVYQGLSSVTKDTYQSLQMKQLPPR